MVPRVLVQASGRMALPLTEIWKTAERADREVSTGVQFWTHYV